MPGRRGRRTPGRVPRLGPAAAAAAAPPRRGGSPSGGGEGTAGRAASSAPRRRALSAPPPAAPALRSAGRPHGRRHLVPEAGAGCGPRRGCPGRCPPRGELLRANRAGAEPAPERWGARGPGEGEAPERRRRLRRSLPRLARRPARRTARALRGGLRGDGSWEGGESCGSTRPARQRLCLLRGAFKRLSRRLAPAFELRGRRGLGPGRDREAVGWERNALGVPRAPPGLVPLIPSPSLSGALLTLLIKSLRCVLRSSF